MESQVNLQGIKQVAPPPANDTDVEVTVEYLPAAEPFHRTYDGTATVGTVRSDAMTFFGVSDHRDRDTHQFFLEFNGERLTNMNQTLEQLLGPHRKGAHFNLVEQITPGCAQS
ncbi:MAG: hypothetical protein WCF26_24170 [Candidatus Sulfotelmatobacter sp.]